MPAELTFVATSLLAAMWASLIGSWRQARPPQRFAAVVGAALMVVGVAHLAVWLVVGGAWAGPVSFRKPTTFGVSFGLTTITLAWVTGHLRISDRARWLLLGPLAVADAYEVAWVAVQRWRGVASHFNFATRLDTGLFLAGGAAIAVTVTVIVVLAVLAFTAMQATPSMALAIRAGLLILVVAQAVGGWMIQHGVGPASDGATTGLTTFGPAGVMKVPHAVAIHAIQVLPVLAWLLSFATLAERRRLGLVAIATLGYVALVVVSLLQTATGLAPWDVGALAAVLYLVGVGLLGVPFVAALLALRHPLPEAETLVAREPGSALGEIVGNRAPHPRGDDAATGCPDMTAPSVSVQPPDLQQPSDAKLIEQSLAEPEVFAVLFDRYAADIHHYAARRLGASAADDLVAETSLAAFRRRSSYDTSRSQARPWLYGIATTLIARQRRSEQRLYRALARTGVDPLPEPIADQVVRRVAAQGQQRRLAAALAGLPSADREVLLLVAWRGLSYEEIAEAVAVPVGTVRSRLHRARRKVREALADAEPFRTTEEA